MCTLIILWRTHPAAPLVLALNRDELLARQTAPLARWDDAPIVAGRDLESGGTWFGVGEHVVAAITNHRSGMGSPRGGRSRGELVVDAARQRSLDDVRAALQARPMTEYGGFHLLVADGRSLSVFSNRNGALEEARAAPGVHVLGNFGLDDETDPVVATVKPEVERFLARARDGAAAPDEDELAVFLKEVLAQEGPGWPCVHLEVPGGAFGTRSSALLFSRSSRPRLEVTEGSPRESPWRDVSALL